MRKSRNHEKHETDERIPSDSFVILSSVSCFSWFLLFVRPRRSMALRVRLEIAEAGPAQRFAEIDLGHRDRPPLRPLRERLALPAVDRRQHPVEVGAAVGATDDENVV